ncbi:MAG: hypothetical protein KI790_15290 [Cyclobacteriaceae bacterium]|nr:hypothetical protein [Cyclobacteriaceae bacterium HetDA_MAG_MS6]
MRIIRLLVQSSMPLFIFACVASVLTGICSTVVIKLIHNVIQANELKTENFAWQFAIYWVGYGVLALSATYSVSVLTQSIVHRLRVQLSRQILNAEYQSMEENQLRLIPILTEDIKTISYAIDRLPSVTTGLATVTGLIIIWHGCRQNCHWQLSVYSSWPIWLQEPPCPL